MRLTFRGMLPVAVKGRERLVVNGETIEVEDDIGRKLLGNQDWEFAGEETFRDKVKTKPAEAKKRKRSPGLTTDTWPTGG